MHMLNAEPVQYPERDGNPMSDNTRQAWWLVYLYSNLDALLSDFVAMDLLWYPVKGNNQVRLAPDVLVALGRPKGHRGSYRQWEEDDHPLDVVFEIFSPGNSLKEMEEKRRFYECYGVQEFYLYNPDSNKLTIWLRQEDHLLEVPVVAGFRSPLLGIQFRLGEELRLFYPDGTPFLTLGESQQQVLEERQRAERLAAKLRALGIDPEE